MATDILLLVLGFVLLIMGGESFVKGASRLAYAFKVSPLVIGLTVVAIGTSAPEFTVALRAALSGHMDVSFGNIMGSNIFNVFFNLGLVALIRPFRMPALKFQTDMLWMLSVVIVFIFIVLDLTIQLWEAGVLLALAFVYMFYCLRRGPTQSPSQKESPSEFKGAPLEYRKPLRFVVSVALFWAGGFFLSQGAGYLVNGAVGIARHLGLSEFLIGAVIVALGTALPELVTSLVATFKGKSDIAVGNIIGSNIYNFCLIIGGAAALSPHVINVPAQILRFDLLFMLSFFSLWFIMIKKYHAMERITGLFFLIIYSCYLFWQVGFSSKY